MKIPKLYKITWYDAADYTEASWANKEELANFAKEKVVCHSVGFIITHDKKHITIAGDFGDGDFGRIIKIPLVNILEKKTIK